MEEWLASIGLGARIAAFRAHEITPQQLRELTEADLRELGLTISERKRFRAALPGFQASGEGAGPRAERRPLTMMFVDLVASSALAERLEAEDLLEVIRDYRDLCGAAIMQYGGMIARVIGDGILAYFGYPVAHENDPERAVRAALQIVGGIGRLATPAGDRLDVRIGMSTGRVIISDLFAGGSADRHSIIGSTPNLAARLQSLAPPGGIVISDDTYQRIAGLFESEDLGQLTLHGFDHPHRVWRITGPAVIRSGFAGSRNRLTPFFNRHADRAVLDERWAATCRGESAVVLVMGEAGIGKTRLVEQFLASNTGPDTQAIRLVTSSFGEDSPLHPLVAFLTSAARITTGQSTEGKLLRLSGVLAGDRRSRQTVLPLFAELIGIDIQTPEMRALPAAARRERLFEAVVDQVLLAAEAAPLCLVLEDLHWLDPTSRELLDRLIDPIRGHRVMLLMTSRDGFQADWLTRRSTTVLRMVPLAPSDVAGLVQSLFGDRPVHPRLAEMVARRTDGVPLYVEEVTRSLLQRAQADLDTDPFDEGAGLGAIPASLHESFVARLDRCGPAKEIAQIAAVAGRSVPRDLLSGVSGLAGAELDAALATLAEADVLFPDQAGDRVTFAHALLRDAAYDSLLREHRRDLHGRVARALHQRDAEGTPEAPEQLAFHLTEAARGLEAAPYWLEAGRRALARSALTEATRLLRRGLAPLEKLPPTRMVLEQRLALSSLLGPALIAVRGPGAAETQDLYNSAYALSQDVPDDPAHFPIYWGWWRLSRDFQVKQQRAQTLLVRATRRGDPELLLQAHHCNWANCYASAQFDQCCEHIAAGLAIYEQGDYRHHARLYGNHDAKVCAHGEMAQLDWIQGRPVSALRQEAQSLAWAEAIDHLGSRVHAMDMRLLHRTYRREHSRVFELSGDLASFASDHALADHRAKALIFRGWTVALQGDPAAGLNTLQEGLDAQTDIGTTEDLPVYLCLLADALRVAGQADKAVERLTREKTAFERFGYRIYIPELMRTLARMMLAADAHAEGQARTLLDEARVVAEQQGAAMLGLRIAMTQARLDKNDCPGVALRRLEAAVARVTEDDGGVDLTAARALQDKLRKRIGDRVLGG